ncbi:hypothetical protein KUCAC02_035080 [Chaenocephalus aceratus]|nr:hypothetical protein KUCAC02_035080 [Chaenocephalus aceratus]
MLTATLAALFLHFRPLVSVMGWGTGPLTLWALQTERWVSPVGVSQGGGSHLMSKLGGESYGSNMEGQETNMEPKEEREGAPDDSLNRLHDNKGHTKLLQLLTTKPEPLETPLSPGGEGKEGRGAKTQRTPHASSLKEKHKILHQLLQNSTSPVDLAKLTAEATGKEPGQEQNQGAGGQGSGPDMGLKQEPLSPKKKDNALLRYLLDKDDTAGKEKMKLEAGEVKLEGGKHPTVKTEKQDAGYDRAEQVRAKQQQTKTSSLSLSGFFTTGCKDL